MRATEHDACCYSMALGAVDRYCMSGPGQPEMLQKLKIPEDHKVVAPISLDMEVLYRHTHKGTIRSSRGYKWPFLCVTGISFSVGVAYVQIEVSAAFLKIIALVCNTSFQGRYPLFHVWCWLSCQDCHCAPIPIRVSLAPTLS